MIVFDFLASIWQSIFSNTPPAASPPKNSIPSIPSVPSNASPRAVIAIARGHRDGGGARGIDDLEETAVTSQVAFWLCQHLIKAGHHVEYIVEPSLSNDVGINARVRAVNAGHPVYGRYTLAAELHADAVMSTSARGGHVIYHHAASRPLAERIAAPLAALMPGRAEKVQKKDWAFARSVTACPAVMVECGFLTNPADAAMLRDNPSLIAKAIADGIEKHLISH